MSLVCAAALPVAVQEYEPGFPWRERACNCFCRILFSCPLDFMLVPVRVAVAPAGLQPLVRPRWAEQPRGGDGRRVEMAARHYLPSAELAAKAEVLWTKTQPLIYSWVGSALISAGESWRAWNCWILSSLQTQCSANACWEVVNSSAQPVPSQYCCGCWDVQAGCFCPTSCFQLGPFEFYKRERLRHWS